MLNPMFFLKLAPFATVLWFFKSQIPTLFFTVIRWLMGHKKISAWAIVLLIVLAGLGANYWYITHLKSEIVELEETVNKKNDYITTLISDIMLQNEAINEMRSTQERLLKEARARLDAELKRQETQLEQIESVEELNKWLDGLRY